MPEACAKRFHLQIYVYIYLWVLRRGGVKGGLSGKKGAWSQPRRLVTFLHKRTQFSMRIWVRAYRLWILPLVLALVLATCQCVVNFSWKGGVKSPPRQIFKWYGRYFIKRYVIWNSIFKNTSISALIVYFIRQWKLLIYWETLSWNNNLFINCYCK